MSHAFTDFLAHIIRSTYERAPSIVDEIAADLHGYLGGILRELRAVPIMIGGMRAVVLSPAARA
jgi:hypothetical protein